MSTKPSPQEQRSALTTTLATQIVRLVERHPEAPEGIEFFHWTWVPGDAHFRIEFLRPMERPCIFDAGEGDLIEPHIIETDTVTPSPLHGEVAVNLFRGTQRLQWRVGWNRLARQAVLWFADGNPRAPR